jgi:nitrogen-specific signal transduction histidine kinase
MEVFYFKNSIIQRLEILSNFAAKNNVRMNLKIDDSIPSVVCGDRKKFEQLFFNLLMKLLSDLDNKQLNIYCRLRGIINKMDFTI